MRHFIIGRVVKIQHAFEKRWVRGTAKDAEFEDVVVGHDLHLDTGTTLRFGPNTKPDCEPGDEVRVAYQQKHDVENKDMADAIGISSSTLSRVKNGSMPDAEGMAKLFIWLISPTTVGATGGSNGPFA